MHRTADFDTLALSIEDEGIDKQILQVLGEIMFPRLAEEDANGNNAFRRACYRRQFEAAKVYLDALSKKNPDIINETIKDSINEGTLLHFAVMTGKHEMIRFLLERNACVGKKDKNGMTAWDLAVAHRDDCAIGEFAEHHVSAGLKGHWYRRRVERDWNGVSRQMTQVLVKNTKLQDETKDSCQRDQKEYDAFSTVVANKVSDAIRPQTKAVLNEAIAHIDHGKLPQISGNKMNDRRLTQQPRRY